jgi:hypothetical protein
MQDVMAANTQTVSIHEPRPDAPRPGPYLVVALECTRPSAGAARFSLAGIQEAHVGRGPERRARRAGGVLHLEIPDPALSSDHVRLFRDAGEWWLEDPGSKNGTFVDGTRIQRGALDDGAVIDAGRTVLVFGGGDGTADVGDLALGLDGADLDTLEPALAGELATLAQVATSAVSILLLGETGTGKEVAAQAIHARSGRSGRYVAVNCGALPPSLIESELFGHRKGAFSGAVQDRLGLVRAADSGTLMLDEIGELASASQASLLRVLQEREVLPVGGEQAVAVDVRWIAATCQDLPAAVALDRFRRDLYARIAGFTITLPPLRQRRADLGLLIARLLARHCGDRALPHLERAAARALFLYSWPHNIRELEQTLTAALARTEGAIGLDHLPASVTTPAAQPEPLAVDHGQLDGLLRAHRGNVSRVAKALGTSRSQVRRLAARLGLVPDSYRG